MQRPVLELLSIFHAQGGESLAGDMMATKEEELVSYMYAKNEKLKEENANLQREVSELRSKQNTLALALRKYDFIVHEFEGMLLYAGASPEVIKKLKDRGLANAHV